ncbi:acyl-CoA dehydrogenase family protein [Nocardia goodfellowii]
MTIDNDEPMTSANSSSHSGPRDLLADWIPAEVQRWLYPAVPDTFFEWPNGLTREDRLALVYHRARQIGHAAPKPQELLDNPPALCALLARAAVADPDLFHILLVHYTLVLAPILQASPAIRGERMTGVLDALESMDSFGAALMTESARSNSHLHLRTQAVFDPATGDFVLHTPDTDAVKFPNSTGHPRVPKTGAVYAQLVAGGQERGTFVFVVPLRNSDGSVVPGVEITPAPDTYALPCDFASVRFTKLRMPFDAWLSNGAAFDADGNFEDPQGDSADRLTTTMRGAAPHVWRAVIAASASIAQRASVILQGHTDGRRTMGRLAPEKELIRYRIQQEAVLNALAGAYVLTLVATHTIGQPSTGPAARKNAATWSPWAAVDDELPLLKATATRICLELVASCRTHCGAAGFIAHNHLNAYHGFVASYFCAGGDNDLIQLDTAHTMTDSDQALPPNSNQQQLPDLASPATWRILARATERNLRQRLIDRIRDARSTGVDEFTVWNDNLALAQATADARGNRIVLEILADAHDRAPYPLQRLLCMYALSWIERYAGSLTDQQLTPPHLFDHLWERRRKLCDELTPHIPDFATAFHLPHIDR